MKYFKFLSRKISLVILCVSSFAYVFYPHIKSSYDRSQEKSIYEKAADLLEFKQSNYDREITSAQKQEALLNIFFYAGYFSPTKTWHDVNAVGFKDNEKVFKKIMHNLEKSGALDSDSKNFNARVLRKNLFDNADLSETDALDYLLYLGQNAFNRKYFQERNELEYYDWMQQNKDDYLEDARIIGLIDAKLPNHEKYIEAWIVGASRFGILARIIDFNYLLGKDLFKLEGSVLILTGQRPLWAEIDGISSKLLAKMEKILSENKKIDDIGDIAYLLYDKDTMSREGKEYMLYLAELNNIELDKEKPFIKYSEEDNVTYGMYPDRTYPNYVNVKDNIYLSETMMSQDLLNRYLSDKNDVEIIDTKFSKNGERPDTSNTSYDAAVRLVSKIQKNLYDVHSSGKYYIILSSNQPYIDRQALVAQKELNKVMKNYGLDIDIKVEGVGFSAKEQDIAKIHSELGALIFEKYQAAFLKNSQLQSGRDLKNLIFSSRPEYVKIESMPDYSTSDSDFIDQIGEYMQLFFDKYF